MNTKPECVDAWLEAFHEVAEAMSEEPEFVSCQLHRDAREPNVFTLYERWAEPSVEAFVENQSKPYRAAYDAKLESLLQGPREPQVLVPLAHWPRG